MKALPLALFTLLAGLVGGFFLGQSFGVAPAAAAGSEGPLVRSGDPATPPPARSAARETLVEVDSAVSKAAGPAAATEVSDERVEGLAARALARAEVSVDEGEMTELISTTRTGASAPGGPARTPPRRESWSRRSSPALSR